MGVDARASPISRASPARRGNGRARERASARRHRSSVRAISREDVKRAAHARGLVLEEKFYGPCFKMIARKARRLGKEGDETRVEAGRARTSDEDANVVATHEGFVAPPPFGILHMDSMRVYNSRIAEDEKGTMRSTFGIAILLGTLSLLAASEAGCKKCELLAIDDGNEYAKKLVRYYSRLGFKVVRVVGENGLSDVPDLLVWGGVGTRMDGDVSALLEKWGNVVQRSIPS